MATQTARRPAIRLPRLRRRGPVDSPTYLGWSLAGYAAFIAVWQLLAMYLFEPFILPAPSKVLQDMWQILASGNLWGPFWATAKHLAIGFFLAYTLGTAIGIAMGRSAYWDGFFRDYIMLTLTTPGLVFALIAVMIFALSPLAPITAIVLTSLPHVTVNVVEGVRAIPKDLMDMATAYGVSRRTQLKNIVLPAVAPFLFAAARYGFAISWKITALTELFGGEDGVGIQIRVRFELFQTSGVLAWTFFLIGLALLVERLVLQRLERRFFRWRPKAFA